MGGFARSCSAALLELRAGLRGSFRSLWVWMYADFMLQFLYFDIFTTHDAGLELLPFLPQVSDSTHCTAANFRSLVMRRTQSRQGIENVLPVLFVYFLCGEKIVLELDEGATVKMYHHRRFTLGLSI